MKTNKQHNEELEKLQDMIESIGYCMLTTVQKDGELMSRPMSTVEMTSDSALYFFTKEFSGKVEEILQHGNVNVAYADKGKNTYVSVSGKASLVTDHAKIKDLWSPIMKAWFPEGLDDPKLALLKVDMESAEYWNDAASKVWEAYKIGKALLTGEQYKADKGGHNTVEM